MSDYLEQANAATAVIVQAEHVDAVDNAAAIASVAGIDGVLIGPFDLSASLGLPGQLDHPDVVAAIEVVRDTGATLGKPVGCFSPTVDDARVCVSRPVSAWLRAARMYQCYVRA